MSVDIRILLLADSHLGFDLPVRPRVERRRRGHDFLANYATALAPALAGDVDVVVHAGDMFDRPVIPESVAWLAFEPLRRVADRGVPVFIVPGNHERSRLPHSRFTAHRHVHVFDRARTFTVEIRGIRIALMGFPYERRAVRTRFAELLERTEWQREQAALRLLCIHHCVEGATVGPAGFTFTSAADVIRTRDIPVEFACVLAGHIHRHQVLTRDLQHRPLVAPVLYPGSIERTSLAEMDETKGFMIVRLREGSDEGCVRWEFHPLPARPMIFQELVTNRQNAAHLASAIRATVDAAPPNAVVTIRVSGDLTDAHFRSMSTAYLRTIVPPTMNLDVRPRGSDYAQRVKHGRRDRSVLRPGSSDTMLQLDLGSSGGTV